MNAAARGALGRLIATGLVVIFSLSFPACRRVTRPHDRAQLHSNQGVVYLNRQEYDKALQEFKIAVELSPEYADAHHNMGVLYEKTGDLKSAEASYRKAIKSDYRYAQPHNGLCSVYLRLKRYEEAVKEAAKAIKKDPTLADAAYCQGLAYERMPNFEESAKSLREATDMDPNHYMAHNELGKVYLQQNRYDDALNRFRVSVEVFPNYEEGWKNLGATYLQKGDLAKAEQAAKAALGINPKNIPAHKLLGTIYLRRANAEPVIALNYCRSAVAEFRQTTKELDRFDGDALANLGIAERCVGSEERRAGNAEMGSRWLQQAERTFLRSIEVDPERCMTYLSLGDLRLDDLRDTPRGISALEQALQCTEKSKIMPLPLALYRLGSHYMEHGQIPKGKKYLCRYVQIVTDPLNPQVAKANAVLKSNGGC